MSNVKYTLGGFSAGDYRAVERYLNEQAAAGWELVRAGAVLAKWRRTDRKDLRWCVDLASTRQSREERLDYLAFCGEGGWELSAYTGGMYLFRSRPREEAIPVQTDPVLERKNYNRYYIRNCVLSVLIVLAWIGFYALLGWGMGSDWGEALQELCQNWRESWTLTALLPAAVLWGLCAVWKLADFSAGLWRARGGAVPVSPRWVMRANGLCGVLSLLGGVLVIAGALLDSLLGAGRTMSMGILLAMWGCVCLYRGFLWEEDLYPGERKRLRRAGFALIGLLAVLIVGRAATPYGTWGDYRGSQKTEAHYAAMESAPVVRLEELGLGAANRTLADVAVPAGHIWRVETSERLWLMGSESVRCWTERQAIDLAEDRLAALAGSAGGISGFPMPGVELKSMALDWADAAWYGEYHAEDGEFSVLLLRLGRLVCRITVPGVMDMDQLAAVQARLSPWATER